MREFHICLWKFNCAEPPQTTVLQKDNSTEAMNHPEFMRYYRLYPSVVQWFEEVQHS